MLPLFTRRVALSAHSSTAVYARILHSSAPNPHHKRILDKSLRTPIVQSFASPQRNASTNVIPTTNKAKSSNESVTVGGRKPGGKLTLEQEIARRELLLAKKEYERKKKAEKAASLRAKALAEREKKRARKPKLIKPPPHRMPPFSLFIQEVGKPLIASAADWRDLSEERKQEYTVRARAIANKRREDLDLFMKSVSKLDIVRYNRHQRSIGKRAILVKKLDTNGRPLRNFMRYVQEFRTRPDQAGKPSKEISIAAGEAWRSLTQEERDSYKTAPSESATA